MTDNKEFRLSRALSYTLRSMPRGKKYAGSIKNFCEMPFFNVNIDHNSDCFLCHCEGWLPIPVGKVADFHSLDSIFSSPMAKLLQDDITAKKFTWCAVEHCGVTQKNIKKSEYHLAISIDNSCNLACPSCRREPIMLEHGSEFDKKISDLNRVVEWLENFDQPITITLGGTGDALASEILRNFIRKYKYKPNQKFIIKTNGLLIKKIIPDSAIRSAISLLSISVDAATADVYEVVRRPGKWKHLMENLHWVHQNCKDTDVVLNFVVQATNFRDLPAFVELCQNFGFSASISPLNDWGTWNSKPVGNPDAWTLANGTYLDHDVCNHTHHQHQDFLKILQIARQNQSDLINFTSYFDRYQ